MMSSFRCCFLFLLLNVLVGWLSGTGISSKFVCPGDSVQLFQNIKFDNWNAYGSLYINGDRNLRIATWTVQNYTLNASFLPEYKDKVHLNKNGTILLDSVHRWDEAKYYITIQTDAMLMTDEVHIYVMDAPAYDCRPNIVQLGNILTATLKHNDCGRPVATLYWKDCCGVSNSSEPMLKLTPGKEACTCYACIVSPALTCARNSMQLNHCTTFSIGGTNSPTVSLEPSDVKTVVFIVVGIILGISFLLVITLIAILIRRRRKSRVQKRYKESKGSVLATKSRKLKLADVPHRVRDGAFEMAVNTGNKCGRELNDMAFSPDSATTRILELDDGSEEMHLLLQGKEIQSSAVVESDDQEQKTKETTPEYPHRTDSGTTEKIPVMPATPRCNICRNQKIEMFVMPCNHREKSYIPTCIECSASLTMCERCKVPAKKNWEYELWAIL